MVVQNKLAKVEILLHENNVTGLSHYKLRETEAFNAVLVISEVFYMPDKTMAFLPVISVNITIDKQYFEVHEYCSAYFVTLKDSYSVLLNKFLESYENIFHIPRYPCYFLHYKEWIQYTT